MVATPVAASTANLTRLRMVLGRLGRVIRQQTGGDGLTHTQSSLLFSIRRMQPVTAGDLAAAEEVTPPSITRLLDRLERQALITRASHPTDGRVSMVALTASGELECKRILRSRDAWLSERLKVFSPDELAHVLECLPLLERLCEPALPPTDDT